MDLLGKVILITGATGGIGSELSKSFVNEGAKVVLIGRNESKLKDLVKSFEGEGHKYFVFDFTKTEKIDSFGDMISESIPSVDVMIHAAGVGVYKNMEDVGLHEWEDSFAINVTTPFFLTKKLLPVLQKPEESVVINIGSGMGNMPTPCRSVYCSTKYALRGMTLSLAAEFEHTNVNFVHVALGSTLTDFGPLSIDQKKEENLKGKNYLTPEWVAEKFVEIVKEGKYDHEMTLSPTGYESGS